ncbi:MAG: FkbM family methyltransferase [Acidimicrobiales bacterium]|nr:FkbM family methyltransferase [Acidimicrobiales bacterium]
MPEVFVAVVSRVRGTVLDVGANTGLYSLLATAAGAERVVAFEPFAPVLGQLRENLRANDPVLTARIDVVPYAVADTAGTAALHVPPPTGGYIETSASLSATFKDEIASTQQVPVVTVDGHVGVDGPTSVLKVDVEGMDHLVLEGARACLAEHRPLTFIEVLPRAEMRQMQEIVDGCDYTIVPLWADRADVASSVEFHADAHNQLLVPTEQSEEILEVVSATVGSDGGGGRAR